MNALVIAIFCIPIYLSLFILFPKANRPIWGSGNTGGITYLFGLKLLKKPWWWVFLLLFPGVNFLMVMIMSVNMANAFNQRKSSDTYLAFFLTILVFTEIGI